MRRRRIISCKSKTPIQAEKSFSFSAFVLKLWLCEPLYLPALRATFFQKKACMVPLQLPARIVRDPSVARFARASSPFRGAKTH